MQRVCVVGNSGAGKTTFAQALSETMAAPHLELDAVFHQPGWTELPCEEFRARVAEFVAADRWVVDGNYSQVQDVTWERADTVVWLDPPRRTVMRRIIWRTLRRLMTRAELWNGNTEQWSNFWRADPGKSIIAWAWTRHRYVRNKYAQAATDPAYQQLRFIRVRTSGQKARLIEAVRRPAGAGSNQVSYPPGRRSAAPQRGRARS